MILWSSCFDCSVAVEMCCVDGFRNICSGTFEVLCSKDVKIQGIIGPCASLEKVSFFKGTYFIVLTNRGCC